MAAIAASDRGQADAALVQRFRQAQSERERTAVFADVVRHHGDAVLGCCARRLWPDADAVVVAAGDVLIAARLVAADSAKLERPDRLRDWLLGIAANASLTSALPARIDDINWAAVRAHVAPDVPETHDSQARRASLRHWLEQIAATLPEARQRLFDLFVTRGLDSRNAARELGTNVAEVRRLRRENRQAILRAFEVTALAAGQADLDQPGRDAPACGDLRRLLADARHNGDPQEDGRPRITALPAALRLTVTRHLSQCGACQGSRDDYMARWAPEMLPILAGVELNERVMEDLHLVPGLARSRDARGAHRRVAPVGTASEAYSMRAVVRRVAATAGAGLFVALLLLAFVWPGFLHGTPGLVPRDYAAPSSQDPSSSGAPQATGTIDGVPGNNNGRHARAASAGLLSSPPSKAAGSVAAPSMFASPTPTAPYGVQTPTPTPTPTARQTSGTPPTSSTPAPSPSATQRTGVPSTPWPSASPSTPSPTKSPSPTTSPTTSPSPSASPSSTPPSTPSPAMSPAPSPTASTPSPSAPPSSAAPQPTLAPSTPALASRRRLSALRGPGFPAVPHRGLRVAQQFQHRAGQPVVVVGGVVRCRRDAQIAHSVKVDGGNLDATP